MGTLRYQMQRQGESGARLHLIQRTQRCEAVLQGLPAERGHYLPCVLWALGGEMREDEACVCESYWNSGISRLCRSDSCLVEHAQPFRLFHSGNQSFLGNAPSRLCGLEAAEHDGEAGGADS